MSDKSAIEWTDSSWNPVTGCTKVSQGCKNCYAERLFPRAYGRESVGSLATGDYRPRKFTDVVCHPERLDQPLRWKKPRRIFVNSMSDLFHEDVPDAFILQVFDVMRQSENGHAVQLNRLMFPHTFQILTKRPARMLDFCTRLRFAQNDERGLYLAAQLPHNGFNPMHGFKHVWLGVSVEDQATFDERVEQLGRTPAAVRFISAEPLLADIDVGNAFDDPPDDSPYGKIHWLIAGGESGPNARSSQLDWFRSVRDQCAAAGVAFFMKQLGRRPLASRDEGIPWAALEDEGGALTGEWGFDGKDRAGSDPSEWPEDLRVREYPA